MHFLSENERTEEPMHADSTDVRSTARTFHEDDQRFSGYEALNSRMTCWFFGITTSRMSSAANHGNRIDPLQQGIATNCNCIEQSYTRWKVVWWAPRAKAVRQQTASEFRGHCSISRLVWTGISKIWTLIIRMRIDLARWPWICMREMAEKEWFLWQCWNEKSSRSTVEKFCLELFTRVPRPELGQDCLV